MPETEKTFQRQVAYKIRISDILNCPFGKDDASAGYIKLNGTNISRANVIANVVYKSEDGQNSITALIDDGTGKILLRTFEKNDIFSKVDVGDVTLVIGRIREFGNERYILPEIVKRLQSFEWMTLRKIELKDVVAEAANKSAEKIEEQAAPNANEGIYLLIKKLDGGEGSSIEDVVRNSNDPDAEKIISRLLENGDIFEIRPGRLKVLE